MCIKIIGSTKINEDKPKNQNHDVISRHGEALQIIHMNQDNLVEEGS